MPANKQASIEVPLSVLEAMSCNLPVITTRFGALPTTFEKGQGLVLFDSERGLRPELSRARNHPEVRTRDKVLPYSWGSIRERLDAIYQRLLTSR
jgi:glycosyltransferase involved in cell wall biosynthesis